MNLLCKDTLGIIGNYLSIRDLLHLRLSSKRIYHTLRPLFDHKISNISWRISVRVKSSGTQDSLLSAWVSLGNFSVTRNPEANNSNQIPREYSHENRRERLNSPYSDFSEDPSEEDSSDKNSSDNDENNSENDDDITDSYYEYQIIIDGIGGKTLKMIKNNAFGSFGYNVVPLSITKNPETFSDIYVGEYPHPHNNYRMINAKICVGELKYYPPSTIAGCTEDRIQIVVPEIKMSDNSWDTDRPRLKKSRNDLGDYDLDNYQDGVFGDSDEVSLGEEVWHGYNE